MLKSLSDIFGEANLEALHKAYELNEYFVVHDLDYQSLLDVDFLQSSESFFSFWKGGVDVHSAESRDEIDSKEMNIKEAESSFDSGLCLLANDVHQESGLLTNYLNFFQSEFGLSKMTIARNLVYLTPEQSGTAGHFDQNINFILQLQGEKKWCLAPNTDIENPMARHTLGHPVDYELESYLSKPLPTEFPSTFSEITLRPGSFLFVPRGMWHKTLALKKAMSLNFTYSAPTWIDLLTSALRARLSQSENWRETAHYLNHKDAHKAKLSIDKFNILLNDLAQDVPHWQAKDILDAFE